MVDVSIIMPIFNDAKYLNRSIDSVIKQTLLSKELICVNDGSSDNSLDIIKEYAEKYDFIKIINQKHKGVAYSRNNGLNMAKGNYVSFLDADDEYLIKTALESMWDVAKKTDANIVSSNIKRIDEDGKIVIDSNYLKNYYNYFPNNSIINSQEYGIPWAFYKNIYKKSFLEENNISFPNLKKGSDAVFLTDVLNLIETLPVINKNLYAYHHMAKGLSEYNIHTYDEKYDYINHFKLIFDIFIKQRESICLKNYKRVFMDYLLYGQNIYDDDLKEILPKIFLNINDYFKQEEDAYEYIKQFFINSDDKNDDDLYYADLKYSLFKEVMENNNLTFQSFDKYLNSSVENKLIYSMKGLKKLESIIDDDITSLNKKINEISSENDSLNKSNNEILSSRGWKITESFRKIKHILK